MLKIRRLIVLLAIAAAIGWTLPSPAMGAGGDGGGGGSNANASDPDFVAGSAAIDKKDWAAAAAAFGKVAFKFKDNADAHNWLGYAQRNMGDLPAALKSYARALEIDPRHRGAHEYVGEAYLLIGDLPKAEQHLARLNSICWFGCEEYTDLKVKIDAFKAKKTS